MIWHPTRVLAPVVVVTGLLAGCVHWWGAGQREAPLPAAPPPPSPSTLTSAEAARQPAVSLEQLLAGRIAGVMVRRAPAGGISVLIRGPSSFYLTDEPLYVVDGIPIEPGRGGTLTWINPQDIASIEVLKDPASTAIYGARGGNGVIVIRTKGSP